MKQGYTFLMAICLLIGQFALAQEVTITGTVSDADSGETLVGVNIVENGGTKGAVTDIDGKYTLTVAQNATVLFRYVGYEVQEMIADVSKTWNVQLVPAGINLNPVVVSASRRNEKILDAPASISLIEAKAIQQKIATSPIDHLKDVSGVDIIKSGLQNSSVVVRGFNNVFSAAVLTLVDNRIAAIPSLRVNSFQMIPVTDDDLERVEVLRGPASALYGPNSANGVIHFVTKSPLDHQSTSVNYGFGFRSKIDSIERIDLHNPLLDHEQLLDRFVQTVSLRHANKLKLNTPNFEMGYKLSANHFTGVEWKYNDPNEKDAITGERFNRPNEAQKYSLDGRIDMRMGKKTELIFAGGLNNASNVEQIPLGSLLAKDWKYWYFQSRLTYKDFFFQFFVNGNDSGDSYSLNTGINLVEKSKFYVAQAQHSISPIKKMKLVYGLDALWTRPNTEGTVNGQYEDEDNIDEYGLYLQGDYQITPDFSIIGATRVDYHNVLNDVFVSPRAAFMYKINETQNVRLTFNRAFQTPAPNTLFLDVRQGGIPTGIDVLALGNREGFNYSYAANPYLENELLPQFRSPFTDETNTYLNVGDQAINDAAWQKILEVMRDNAIACLPEGVPAIAADILVNMYPETIENVGHEVKDINLTTRDFTASDWTNIKDIEGLDYSEVISYELGYKGIVGKNFFFTIDAYRQESKNLLTPTILISPGVLLNTDDLAEYALPIIQENLESSQLTGILTNILDVGEFGCGDNSVTGNHNGTIDDELLAIMALTANSLPIGVITPQSVNGPQMVLATTNISDVTVYGLDLSANMYLSKNFKLSGFYSFVNKDSIQVEGAQFGFVGLNAPKHKLGVGVHYTFESLGLNVGSRFRWYDDYPANSGSFVGRVAQHHEMDLNVSWTPNFYDNLNLTMSVQNLYSNENQRFIGAPQIGRLSMLRVGYKI